MATVLAASVPSYHTPSIPAYPRRLRPLPQPPALKIAPVPAAPPVRTPKARLLHTSTTTPIKKHELYPTLTLLVNNYDEEDSLIRDDFAPPPLKRTGTVPLPPISPIWAAPVTLSPRTVKFHAHVTTTAECCSQTLALLEPLAPCLAPALYALRRALSTILKALRMHARPAPPALNTALGALCGLCERACADAHHLGAYADAFNAAATDVGALAESLAAP